MFRIKVYCPHPFKAGKLETLIEDTAFTQGWARVLQSRHAENIPWDAWVEVTTPAGNQIEWCESAAIHPAYYCPENPF